MSRQQLNTIELEVLKNFFKALAKDAKKESTPSFVPHVTSIVYNCIRRCYYSVTTPIDTIDLKGSIRTWIGRKLHETQILPNGKMELELNWRENNKTILTGRLDEYNGEVLLDKKTTRHIPKYPYPHHIKQIELYNLLLEKDLDQTAKYGAIMYVDINLADTKIFAFSLPQDLNVLEQEVKEKYAILDKALKTGVLPPRLIQQWEPGSIGLVCHYCNYYGRCWQEDYIDPFRCFAKTNEESK